MTQTPEELDLGGDVYILVGPDGSQTRIKVLASLLALVSEYFRTLFGPGFKEGQDLSHGNDITLQDDDPQAFVLLCKILHMQYPLPQQPLSPDDLLSLAVVTDKYGCIKAVALTLNAIFLSTSSFTTFSHACKLTAASYLFDHPRLFQQFTEHLILSYADPMVEAAMHPSGAQVPAQAWRK